jgi:hypothetical protein
MRFTRLLSDADYGVDEEYNEPTRRFVPSLPLSFSLTQENSRKVTQE